MTTAVLSQDTRAVGRGRPGVRSTLTVGSSIGLGIALLWFSILVLIPLAAIVATAGGAGWHGYVDTLTNPQSWAAIKLTVGQSLLFPGHNLLMGTVIASATLARGFVTLPCPERAERPERPGSAAVV